MNIFEVSLLSNDGTPLLAPIGALGICIWLLDPRC